MKSYFALAFILILSAFYLSCSDTKNPVSPGSTSYTYTNKYMRNINKGVPSLDTLNVVDNGSTLSLKFSLDTVISIDGTQKLDVVLKHNNITDTLIKQFTNPSYPSYNFRGCVCSDSALEYFIPGLQDYTGNYKPYSPLSVFSGKPINGPWYLIFSYPNLNKTGVIKSWSITITYNAQSPPVSNIFPLAVGNYWTFAIDTGSIPNVYQTTLNISNKATLHGKDVYTWQWQNAQYFWYLRNESDGVWWYGYSSPSFTDTTTSPFLWIKYPINLNERYYTKQWLISNDTVVCTNTNATFYGYNGCTKYSELSTSSTDSYNPLVFFFNPELIKGINTTRTADFYFKQNTGYIGNEVTTKSSTSINFIRYRLISYHIQ